LHWQWRRLRLSMVRKFYCPWLSSDYIHLCYDYMLSIASFFVLKLCVHTSPYITSLFLHDFHLVSPHMFKNCPSSVLYCWLQFCILHLLRLLWWFIQM
jgi:hypothetical protein